MDLPQELFQAFVFGDPCLHLRKQFFGDVNGAGFAMVLVSHMLASVQRTTVVTTAQWPSAAVGVAGEGGGQDRGGGRQLLEPTLQRPADEGWMLGNAHNRLARGRKQTGAITFSGKNAKKPGASNLEKS